MGRLSLHSFPGRIPGLHGLRAHLRQAFFRALRHVANIEDTRQILSENQQLANLPRSPPELSALRRALPPYIELHRPSDTPQTRRRSDIIFVTGRFRSGSTLVWNLFRRVPSVTAYYEPFNERRWFDPASRGTHVDVTHLDVPEYWSEYAGLAVLAAYFREDWKFRHLYMPADAWNPEMQRYIEILIERAPGRPLLQFNEMDMRLPWLRARFPGARILHICRHPRDQWCSTLQSAPAVSLGSTLRDFEAADGFYLLRWGRDLRHYFPFLTIDDEAHPYELFYQIWKISYLFGRVHADLSICYEEIVRDPAASIRAMFGSCAIEAQNLDELASLVRPGHVGRWRQYAAHGWFASIEARVDATLENYVGSQLPRDTRPGAYAARPSARTDALAPSATAEGPGRPPA